MQAIKHRTTDVIQDNRIVMTLRQNMDPVLLEITRRPCDLLIFFACASVILLSRQAQRQQQRPGRRLGLRLPRLHPPHL